jgi:hypothetical protein
MGCVESSELAAAHHGNGPSNVGARKGTKGSHDSNNHSHPHFTALSIVDMVENKQVSWSPGNSPLTSPMMSPRLSANQDDETSTTASESSTLSQLAAANNNSATKPNEHGCSTSSSVKSTPRLPISENCLIPDEDLKHVRKARGLLAKYLKLDKNLFLDSGLEILNCKKADHNEWHACIRKGSTAVYSCMTTRSEWNVYRGEILLKEVSPQRVASLLLNDHRCHEYDESIIESKVLRRISDRVCMRRLLVRSGPLHSLWPVAAQREFVVISLWDELPNGTFLICHMSVDDSIDEAAIATRRKGGILPWSGTVRGTVNCSGVWLRPTSDGDCLVKMISHIDMGGSIPPKVANKLGHHVVYRTLLNIEKAVVDKPMVRLSNEAIAADNDIRNALLARSRELREWKQLSEIALRLSESVNSASPADSTPGSQMSRSRNDRSNVRRVLFSTPERTEMAGPCRLAAAISTVLKPAITIKLNGDGTCGSALSGTAGSSANTNTHRVFVRYYCSFYALMMMFIVVGVLWLGFVFGRRYQQDVEYRRWINDAELVRYVGTVVNRLVTTSGLSLNSSFGFQPNNQSGNAVEL